MARPKKQPDTVQAKNAKANRLNEILNKKPAAVSSTNDIVQAQEQKPKRAYVRRTLDDVIEIETSNEKYFKYWMRFIGYDIREKLTGRIMTKGEFYRKYTELAEKMSDPSETLDKRFELVVKPKSIQTC